MKVTLARASIALLLAGCMMAALCPLGSNEDATKERMAKNVAKSGGAAEPELSVTAQATYETGVTILFGGDTGWGESYGDEILMILKARGYDHSLARLRPLMAAADFSILNLETPLTNIEKSPISSKAYVHWSHIEDVPEALRKHRVRVISLANNHTLDYGLPGLRQTFSVLRNHQIGWIGAGNNLAEANRPYILEMTIGGQTTRLAVLAGFEYSAKYDEEYDFYATKQKGGAARLANWSVADLTKKLKEKYPGIYVVMFPHWGENYAWRNRRQLENGHMMVDAGVDLIIGHGAHRLQEIEKYNGRWILYNLGNFMFNSPGRFEKLDSPPYGMVALLSIRASEGKLVRSIRLYPILSDNRITQYQPRPLEEGEFVEAVELLAERSTTPGQFQQDVKTGADQLGRYLEISLE